MSEEQEEHVSSPDVHFEPIVKLPLIETKTHEEDEETLVKLRAKLFRYDRTEQPPEWKERGTGEVKLLKHPVNGTVRVVMRRDKTLKICANHYVQPNMDLTPNCKSDKAWVWSTPADYADEEPKPELLAIRFANAENAQKFKSVFDEAKKCVQELENSFSSGDLKVEETKDQKEDDDVTEKLKDLSVQEGKEDGLESKPNCKTKEDKKTET